MALKKYKLGELIEPSDERNSDGKYGACDVRGMTIEKTVIPTKANMVDTDLSKFIIVYPNEFIYNPRTHGKKIGLGFNDTKSPFLISWNNVAFKIKKSAESLVLAKYLYIDFNRPEWDRKACYDSWGTSTEVFTWNAICDMQITLPDKAIQQKYVDIYESMVANQKSYEKGLDDLKLACDAYIEELRRKTKCEKIGDYITFYNEKNVDEKITLEQGVNIKKEFITPQRENSSLASRKIVRTGQIVYCTQLNNENVAVALREGPDCVVSPVYDVVEVIRPKELMVEYLLLWMQRSEFGRFVYWASKGTSYEFLSPENLQNYKIPIPNISVQRSIAEIYKVYTERKRINEQLKQQIKDICPILIKGSLEE
jgi:type I restriction enzyme S subunit